MNVAYERPNLSAEVERVIAAALAEDIGPADITSQLVIPKSMRFSGVMAARHELVVAGIAFVRQVFATVVPEATFIEQVRDGDLLQQGATICTLEGPAQGLLTAERTALNLLQHLSGIATLTRRYADRLAGTNCVLLDTRKTIPGLRLLEKYAARIGGACNHRMGLYDGILIKDNHIAVCGGVAEAVRKCRRAKLAGVEIECDTLSQVSEALDAGPDLILLDNMPVEMIAAAVRLASGRCKLEASGGVTLDTIRAIAETGVDFVSVGRITQSAPAVDIGLDWS